MLSATYLPGPQNVWAALSPPGGEVRPVDVVSVCIPVAGNSVRVTKLIQSVCRLTVGQVASFPLEGRTYSGWGFGCVCRRLEQVRFNLSVSTFNHIIHVSSGPTLEGILGHCAVGGSVVAGTALVHNTVEVVPRSLPSANGSPRGVSVTTTFLVFGASHVVSPVHPLSPLILPSSGGLLRWFLP